MKLFYIKYIIIKLLLYTLIKHLLYTKHNYKLGGWEKLQ